MFVLNTVAFISIQTNFVNLFSSWYYLSLRQLNNQIIGLSIDGRSHDKARLFLFLYSLVVLPLVEPHVVSLVLAKSQNLYFSRNSSK